MFVDQFMGIWKKADDNQYVLELKDNIETIGINESELLSRTNFTIIEINIEEQFIVLHGNNTDGGKPEEFTNKLELTDNGNTLQYSYNYESSNNQSQWMR